MEHLYFTWSAGGATVGIDVDADVITRLKDAVGEYSDSTGWEVGGLLLGTRNSNEQITISDFELVASEHRRGVTFTLSPADRKRLEQRLRAQQRGKTIVGGFRTHRRPGLFMDQYDFELMSRYFPSATDVMLVIRPKDWCAGFFVWEEGDIHRQKSYLEFPFSRALLKLNKRPDPTEAPALVQKGALVSEPTVHAAAAAPVPSRRRKSFSAMRLPTLARVSLVFATLGLVGVLAFYAHQKLMPTTSASPQPIDKQQVTATNIVTAPPPADPYELHVKMPEVKEANTAPAPRRTRQARKKVLVLPEPGESRPSRSEPAPQLPSAPAISKPVAIASITPPLATHSLPRLTMTSVVSLEPAQPSAFSRGFSHVPLLGLAEKHKIKERENFQPPKPTHEVRPKLPPAWQQKLPPEKQIDVKIWIDKQGAVTKAELTSQTAKSEIGDLAARAALQWKFRPAQLAEKPVPSEMVMHFQFVPQASTE